MDLFSNEGKWNDFCSIHCDVEKIYNCNNLDQQTTSMEYLLYVGFILYLSGVCLMGISLYRKMVKN